jgi:DNA-binding transcriptional MerR regulator
MQYLVIEEASKITRTPISTLHQWSHKGIGPPVRKVGRRLLYREDQLISWIESQAKLTS